MTSRVKRLTFIPIPEKLGFTCQSCTDSELVWQRQVNLLCCQACGHKFPGPPCKYCNSEDIKPHQLIFGRWRCKNCNRTYIPPKNSSNLKYINTKKYQNNNHTNKQKEDVHDEQEDKFYQQYNMRPRTSRRQNNPYIYEDNDDDEDDSFNDPESVDVWEEDNTYVSPPRNFTYSNLKNSPLENCHSKEALSVDKILNQYEEVDSGFSQSENNLFDVSTINKMIENQNDSSLREKTLSLFNDIISHLSNPVVDNWSDSKEMCWLKAHRFRLKNDFRNSMTKLLELSLDDPSLILAVSQVLALSTLDRRNSEDLASSYGIQRLGKIMKQVNERGGEHAEQIILNFMFTMLAIISYNSYSINFNDPAILDCVRNIVFMIYKLDKCVEIQTIGIRLLFVILSFPIGRSILSMEQTLVLLSRIVEYGVIDDHQPIDPKSDEEREYIENFIKTDRETREFASACLYRIVSCNKDLFKTLNIGCITNFLYSVIISSVHKQIRLDVLYDNMCFFSEIMSLSKDQYIDNNTRKDLLSHLITLMDVYASRPVILISICKVLISLIPSGVKQDQNEDIEGAINFAIQRGLCKRLKMTMNSYKKHVELQILCFALLTFRLKSVQPVLSKKIMDSIYKYNDQKYS